MTRHAIATTAAAGWLMAASPVQQVQAPVAVGSSCSALMGVGLPQTEITYAIRTYAGTFVLPGTTGPVARSVPPFDSLPEFCRVTATLTPSPGSTTAIELWMPTGIWNGRLLAVGTAGAGRSINYLGMAAAVARGNATASPSSGDTAAVHAMTVRSKSIIESYFGRVPWVSYFTGCGDGGRQGIVAAERHPEDFDGVIAGAPAADAAFTRDLSTFTSTGGRLLLYHGEADPVQPPARTIEYYREAMRSVGADADRSIRLFMMPGLARCGDGPDAADFVTAMERWVEKRDVPERITDRTGVFCAYPRVATYSGAGSKDDARSFVCKGS